MKKFLSLIVAVLVAALAFVVTLPKRYLENAIKSQSMRIPSQSMGMKLLTQNYFTIPLIAPATTPATQYTPGINMGKCETVQFICNVGALGTADYTITVGCSSTAKSTAPDVDLPFRYRKSAAAGTDTIGAITNVALATGINWAYAADSNKLILIDIAAEELTQGYPYVQLTITRAGSASAVGMNVVAVVKPRYPQNSNKDGSGTSFLT